MNSKFFMDDSCFACGPQNPNGLKLNIQASSRGVETEIDLPTWVQGYHNIVHGGIIATILDELAVWAAFHQGYRSVTGHLSMRVKNSMKIGTAYKGDARVTNTKHRLIEAESRILDSSDNLIASAKVKLLRIV